MILYNRCELSGVLVQSLGALLHWVLFCLLRLLQIEGQRQLLRTELVDLQEKKKQREEELRTNGSLQESAVSHQKSICDVC